MPADKSSAEQAAAKLSIVPSVIDFKSVVVGQKNSQTLKITNSSAVQVNLEQLRVSGNGFTLAGVRAPLLLAPGHHANVSVVFAPASDAQATGSLAIWSSDLKTPVHVPLSGTGEKPAATLAVSPTLVNFGSHPVKTSTAQTVTLKNTGNISLALSSFSLPSSSFSVSGLAKGVSLSPDQKLEFQVWFRPSVTGSSSTTFSVEASSIPGPLKITLSGSATSAASAPAPAPSSVPAHSVSLAWSASSSTVVGYHVYRGSSSDGPFNRITSSVVDSLSYKDTAVDPGGHYFYVVTAVEAQGQESAYSNEASAEIPLS